LEEKRNNRQGTFMIYDLLLLLLSSQWEVLDVL